MSELIGHASVAITLDRYRHLFPAALDDAAAAFRRVPRAGRHRSAARPARWGCADRHRPGADAARSARPDARDLNLGCAVRAPEPSYEADEAGFPRREAKLGFPLIALGTILQLVGLFAS